MTNVLFSFDQSLNSFFVYVASFNQVVHVWSVSLYKGLPVRVYNGKISGSFTTITRTPNTTIVFLTDVVCFYENHDSNSANCTQIDGLSPKPVGYYAVSYYNNHQWWAYQTETQDVQRYLDTSSGNTFPNVVKTQNQLVKSLAIYQDTGTYLKAMVSFGKFWGIHHIKYEPSVVPNQIYHYTTTDTWFGCPQNMCIDSALDAICRNNHTSEVTYFRGHYFWTSIVQGQPLNGPKIHSYKTHLSAAFVLNNHTYAIVDGRVIPSYANDQKPRLLLDVFPGLRLRNVEAAASDGNTIYLFNDTAMSAYVYHKENSTFMPMVGMQYTTMRSKFFGVPNEIDAAFVSYRDGKALLYILTGPGLYRSWSLDGGRPRGDDPTRLAPGRGWPCSNETYSSRFSSIDINDYDTFKKYRLSHSLTNGVFDDGYTVLANKTLVTDAPTSPTQAGKQFDKRTLAIIIVLALLTLTIFATIIWIATKRFRTGKKRQSSDSAGHQRRYLEGDATIRTEQDSKTLTNNVPTLVEIQPTQEFTPRVNNVEQPQPTLTNSKPTPINLKPTPINSKPTKNPTKSIVK